MPSNARSYSGHSLLELVVVVAILGICLLGGGFALSRGLSTTEARGAAQAWQAAGTWAQDVAAWQGEAVDLAFAGGRLGLAAQDSAGGDDLGACLPAVATTANVARWQQGEGVVVRFLGGTAYPNSAGSLYFHAPGGDYRVTVRLESGLTVRTWEGGTP
jgi:prepilin-type N-terminal cleavage/methylation domain-containing protein